MKALRYILFGLLILACLGLLGYQYMSQGYLETNQITRAGILILGAVVSMFKKPRTKIANKKATYSKAYDEHIRGAFQDSPKLENQFYNAVHLYNLNKPGKAVVKLESLRKECKNSNEMRAVTIFTALCLDDMQLFDNAITQYQAATHIRDSSSLRSNMGLCYQKIGNYEDALVCYEKAMELDPKNAYAINNLSALHFRLGDFEEALAIAEDAIAVNAKMQQPLTTAAICCGILGNTEKYEKYYRQAVSNGADGKAIKEIIRNMDSEL